MGRKTVHNGKIATEEKWNIVNNENKELIEEFLEYCEAGDKSKLTLTNYTSDLRIFFCWNLENNKNEPFYKITKRALIKYQNYLKKELNLGDCRVSRLKSSLSSLSEFCEVVLEEEVEEWKGFRNIINKIPRVAKGEPRRKKTVIKTKELELFLDKLVELGKIQQACCIALGAFGGARKSELGRFKIEWFNDDNIVYGCWWKSFEKIECKGKGDHRLFKYTFKPKFDKYLNLWIEERKKLNIESEWLLVSKSANGFVQASESTLDGWNRSILNNSFKQVADDEFYFHSLRHYFVSWLKAQKLPNEIVVEIMGWKVGSGDTMVAIYNDINVNDEMNKYFSEEGIVEIEEGNMSKL